MTAEERENIVAYRIEKAEQTIQDIKVAAQNELWNVSANRLYYAAFTDFTQEDIEPLIAPTENFIHPQTTDLIAQLPKSL